MLKPAQDCKNINVEVYEFIGYDLLDQDYSINALTNCGGFDETFLPADIIIGYLAKACDIKKRFLENNPEGYHTYTNVVAVWRHKTTGDNTN